MWFSLLRTSISLGCELWIVHTYSFSQCRTAYTMCCHFPLLCLLIIITFCWIFTAVSLPFIITTKSYFYLEKRADSYFKCLVKQQLLSIRIHLHPFFSPFIHLKSASRICSCQCEMKLQGWFQEHWHEAALGEQSQNQWLLLCNLVGSRFSQTLELINFRTRILKGANRFFFLCTHILLLKVSSLTPWLNT